MLFYATFEVLEMQDMRRFTIILITLLSISGCQDDIQDNSPTVQGILNGNILWRADSRRVFINAENFTVIEGENGDGRLRLVLPFLDVGTYVLGSSSSARATFLANGVLYSTENDGIGSPVYVSDGEIVIENISNGNVTGTFKFNAYDASGQLVVNFIDGVIFNISI